ncbi:hypothetical protein ACFQAS_02825 [Halopenitus salinus]|uniref:AglQ family protein n=1 Tax=Halopenitus salinus TaxID=1198295 RepID=A0ABD5UVJ4_9EURY
MESNSGIVTLHDIIERSARDGLDLQRDDGSFPPGRNYTYDEPETPVRTTSHWLLVLTKAYKISRETVFEDAANSAIDYLLSDDVRPSGFTYHCRNVESKDKCNGLVGQAAPIRALARTSEVFERSDARETAEEVFRLHPFSEELGLWERVETDGSTLSFDRTLNHQIIFSAAAAEIAPTVNIIEERIGNFLDHLSTNMRLHSNGLIKHYVRPRFIDTICSISCAPRRRYDMLINEIAFHYYSYSDERRKKERGYQTVNLNALSKLKPIFPNHEFWRCEKLSRALDFVRDNENDLIRGIDTKHGSLVQGISIAKILHRFEGTSIEEHRERIVSDLCLETDTVFDILDIEGVDENTRIALVSVLTDLPDMDLP